MAASLFGHADEATSAAGLTRRHALSAGAVLLAGSAHHQSPTRQGKVNFGSNRLEWANFKRAVPLAEVARIYHHGLNRFPDSWPTTEGKRQILSFEPHPGDLLAGKFDIRLLGMARNAPEGAVLVPWYEAGPADPRNYNRYGSFVTARNVQACQRYLHRLLGRTNVRVGSIICGPAIQLHAWIAPGLPRYYDDIDGDWFLSGGTFEVARFERRQLENLSVWRRKSGLKWPRIGVAETNCGHRRKQAEWFSLLADYLGNHGGGDVCTFWAESRARQGSAASPWPPRPEVIARLRYLSLLYGGFSSIPA